MAYTQLSLSATPGKRYSFSPKAESTAIAKRWLRRNLALFENMKKEVKPAWQ